MPPPDSKATASAASDTSFRRTWDPAEYAAKAAAREAAEREEGKARYEAKLAGKTYHAHPPSSSSTHDDAALAEARRARLDVAAAVGKVQMISGAMAGVGKRGRGAGFYCEACDLTFKDNLQWVEHLNSRQHAAATGTAADVRRASLAEVLARLDFLRQKRADEGRDLVVGLGDRLKSREEQDEREREAKRVKRREARRKKNLKDDAGDGLDGARPVKDEHGEHGEHGERDADMAKMMGFGGFGSTKV